MSGMQINREQWMDLASCTEVDPDAFFPEKGGTPDPAKRICQGCDVRARCLAYALEIHPVAGVWAGTTLHERVQMMRGAA